MKTEYYIYVGTPLQFRRSFPVPVCCLFVLSSVATNVTSFLVCCFVPDILQKYVSCLRFKIRKNKALRSEGGDPLLHVDGGSILHCSAIARACGLAGSGTIGAAGSMVVFWVAAFLKRFSERAFWGHQG
jgi:acid phosphatase family membrane protein YuiD